MTSDPSYLLLFDVIAQHLVLIAQVELAAGDDGVGPAFAVVAGDLELALELVLFGRRLDQGHRAALITEVEVAVGIGDRGAAAAGAAAGPPGVLAGLAVDADRESVVVPVAAINEAV